MFLGLDPQTLMYLGYSLAAIGTMGVAYWSTKKGIPKLDLKQEDLQLIGKGMLMGALHQDGLDNIMQCIDDPVKSMKELEDAVANFETTDMMHLTLGMQQLAISLYSIVQAVKECDQQVKDDELEIITNMLKQFKNPKEVAYKIGQNLMVNGIDIYKELSAAYTSYYAKEYEAFGKDVGIAVALTFIGSVQPKGDLRNSIMGSAKNQLYPDKDQVLDHNDIEAYQSKLAKVNDLWKLRQAQESDEINKIAKEHYAQHDIIAEEPTFDEDGDAFFDAQENLQNLESNNYFLY